MKRAVHFASSLGFQVGTCVFIRGKDGACSSELRSHVPNGFPVCGRKTPDPRPIVFDYFADAPLHIIATQHLQDHVLGAHPIRQRSGELHSQDFRAWKMVRPAGHSQRHIKPSGSDAQHGHACGAGRVAVRPEDDLAGTPKRSM